MRIKKWNARIWVTIVILFLLVFPKGGFKIDAIPITWGYLLLGITSLLPFFKKHLLLLSPHFRVLLALFPFQLVSLSLMGLNGIEHLGFVISFIIHFFFFPFLFFVLFSKFTLELNLPFFFSLLKRSLLFVSLFGIFIFSFRIITGTFFLIPFLTSNFHDMDTAEIAKNIARGNLFKLFSTYGNGNLYGICLLMLLPLYQLLEKSTFKRTIVKFSLLLTLSRTVWIGLLLEEILRHVYIHKVTLRSFLKLVIRLSVIGFMITFVLIYLDYNISFIFDPTLGGRSDLFSILSDYSWASTLPFDGIPEIVYLGILRSFGLVGLVTFLIAITSPLWIYVFLMKTQTSAFQRSLLTGLFVYLTLSWSDGAILYIPVMAFYWFLSSLLLAKSQIHFEFLSYGQMDLKRSKLDLLSNSRS